MRRLSLAAVAAIPLALMIACSSDGDVEPSDLERATLEGGAASSDATSDARTASEASAEAGDGAVAATYSGEATYYAADGTGACGFKATPNDLNVAAMNGAQYKKTWCGQCVLVTGPKGSVKVRIVDLCPGCSEGDLDLSKQAFATIASLSAGRIKITWHAVPC
jgi:expansin (peptidoglycan-binding protein)